MSVSVERSQARRRGESVLARLFFWSLVSVLLHLVLLLSVGPLIQVSPQGAEERGPIRMVLLLPQPEATLEPEEETPHGQVVDVPVPEESERPPQADFLAEHARIVPRETRTQQVRVNPEVLTPEYSPQDRLELADRMDLGENEPSSGARSGNDRFDPDRNGAMAAIPNPFQLTERDGVDRPSLSSHRSQNVSGAPNNDLLDLEIGDSVHLNTKEFLYAGYLNQVRRLVNFYWHQNLDNLPRGLQIVRPRYKTLVTVVLTQDGLLDSIEIVEESGSGPLDSAVVQAFRIAGPFPPPPEGMVSNDGRADLGAMGFTVEIGQARAGYMGVDPRAGVQFPGILKAPR